MRQRGQQVRQFREEAAAGGRRCAESPPPPRTAPRSKGRARLPGAGLPEGAVGERPGRAGDAESGGLGPRETVLGGEGCAWPSLRGPRGPPPPASSPLCRLPPRGAFSLSRFLEAEWPASPLLWPLFLGAWSLPTASFRGRPNHLLPAARPGRASRSPALDAPVGAPARHLRAGGAHAPARPPRPASPASSRVAAAHLQDLDPRTALDAPFPSRVQPIAQACSRRLVILALIFLCCPGHRRHCQRRTHRSLGGPPAPQSSHPACAPR